MWFEDEEVSGRRFPAGRRPRRPPVLNVSTAGEARRQAVAQRSAVAVLATVAGAGAILLLYLALRAAGQALFTANPDFAITRIEVNAGTEAGRRLAKEYARLSEGMNLFSFSIREVRARVLRSPGFKTMSISRRLPGTVTIDVTERVPLARVEQRGNLVVDGEGWVFPAWTGVSDLPYILGCPSAQIRPGAQVSGMTVAALEMIEACDDPRVGVNIEGVRVDNPGQLLLVVASAGAKKEVSLSWPGMGQRTAESRENLRQKILLLKKTNNSPQSRQLTRLDATFDDRIYGR